MNNPFQTECRAVGELLVAFLTGELESERAAFIQSHLEVCAACLAEAKALQQTQQQASALHLESPALERYPEFLRRLAVTDTAQSQQALVRLTTAVISPQIEGEESFPAPTGVAAVVPLFGQRILVRNGFGRGFELSIQTQPGRELLRVSTTSLTRVAAAAAGISLFTGLALAGMFVLLFPRWQRAVQEPQIPSPQPRQTAPQPRTLADPAPDWVQAITGKDRTLVIWPEGEQVMNSWLEGATTTAPQPLPWRVSGQPEVQLAAAQPIASATDGKSFVIVREMGPAFYAWHVPVDETNTPHPASLPVEVARDGVMPTLAWVRDRYLFAFIRPSPAEPVLVVRELDRLGRLTEQAEVVAVTTEKLDKIGWPTIASDGPHGVLLWMTESGQMQACTLSMETGSLQFGPRHTVLQRQRAKNMSLHATTICPEYGGGYLVCWAELDKEGFDLKLARLSDGLAVQAQHTLLSRPQAPPAFDWRVREQEVSLLWVADNSKDETQGAQLWRRYFNLEGLPLQPPQPLLSGLSHHAIAAFADQHGKQLLWTQRQATEPLHWMSKPLP